MSDTDMINALVAEYQRIIGSIHHKDRDCHFRISKVWSYGGKPTYEIEHTSYLFDHEISDYLRRSYTSNAEAMDALDEMLRMMITTARRKIEEGYWL